MPELNTVAMTGNLTKDPELRHTQGGTAVATLRIASNTRRKDASGQWEDKPNYFDVVVWGKSAENAAQYLAKGRKVGIQGRLEWREWTDKNDNKRQSVEIVAQDVVFLGGKDGQGGGQGQGGSDLPADTGGTGGQGGEPDDDIPF